MNETVYTSIEAGNHVKIAPLARALNMSLGGLYSMVRRGQVKGVRIGAAVRVPASEARRLLALPETGGK